MNINWMQFSDQNLKCSIFHQAISQYKDLFPILQNPKCTKINHPYLLQNLLLSYITQKKHSFWCSIHAWADFKALTARLPPDDRSVAVRCFRHIWTSSACAILEAHGEAGCVGSASLPAILVGLLLRSRLPKEVHNFVVHVASYHEKDMTFQPLNPLFCFNNQNIKYQAMM